MVQQKPSTLQVATQAEYGDAVVLVGVDTLVGVVADVAVGMEKHMQT